MKTYVLLALMGLLFLGCAKKQNDSPAPSVDLVGTWEMVVFTVTPAPVNGTSDYLAYLRQIFGYNCSTIEFYYNFKSDQSFTETMKSTCQSSGTTNDEVEDGGWSATATTLNLTTDDGSGGKQTRSCQMTLTPATTGKYATMTLTFEYGGSSYLIKLNKQ